MGEKVFIGALLGWAGAFILMCMIFGSFPKKPRCKFCELVPNRCYS
jgi:hypothetical protein